MISMKKFDMILNLLKKKYKINHILHSKYVLIFSRSQFLNLKHSAKNSILDSLIKFIVLYRIISIFVKHLWKIDSKRPKQTRKLTYTKISVKTYLLDYNQVWSLH